MTTSPSSAEPSRPPRIAVIGGGISGTAAAWTASREAARRGKRVEVVLFERERKLGGKASTLREGEWLFETGPLGYLNNEPAVDELVVDAGLEGELVRAGAAQSHRFVFLDGKMKEVAARPLRFLTGGLLSLRGLSRVAREPFVPGKRDRGDESVWDFAARRLGPEFADRLIHPMVLGIFAGDAKRLSLPSAFPIMAELERDHGSLIRAQISRARARRRGELPPRRSTLCSFREGLQALPCALAERGTFETRTSSAVASLVRHGDVWRVSVKNDESLDADAVILASEGWRTASIFENAVPEAARALREIAYPPIHVVGLGYGPEARERIPEGFGVLIPRGAGFRSLGVTWDGRLFPGRNAGDGLLVRVLLGGTFDPEVAELDSEEVTRLVKEEMRRLFQLSSEPLFVGTRLWENAIPQYEIGHAARVKAVEDALARVPGIYLAGNALHGTSFGKAAARGVFCGREAIEWLSR